MDEPSRPVVRLRRRAPGATAAPARPEPAEPPVAPRPSRRHAIVAVAAAVLLVSGVVAAIASSGGDDGDDLDDLLVLETPSTQRIPRSTTTTTVRSVTVPIAPLPPTPVAPGRPAPLAPRPSTTTTTTGAGGGGGEEAAGPMCRDSTDPACGPWYWDPEPAPNQPLVITIVYQEIAGLRYGAGASLRDADAAIVCWRMVTNTGVVLYDTPCSPPACLSRYGPWTPPAAVPGSQNLPNRDLPPGASSVVVHAESAGYGCDPYGSAAVR